METYTLKLATLFGDGYPLIGTDEDTLWAEQEQRKDTHVAVARKEITRLRNNFEKWVTFIDSDSDAKDKETAESEKQLTVHSIT